eukprot:gene375-437_t
MRLNNTPTHEEQLETQKCSFKLFDIERDESKKLRNAVKIEGRSRGRIIDLSLLESTIPADILAKAKIYKVKLNDKPSVLFLENLERYFLMVSFESCSDAIAFQRSFTASEALQRHHKAFLSHHQIDPQFSITKDEMEQLPQAEVANITVVSEEEDVEDAIRKLLNGKLANELVPSDAEQIVLGVDCEWPALSKFLLNKDAVVSLIQISNGIDTILFRVCNIGMPSELKDLLLSPLIKKVGYARDVHYNRELYLKLQDVQVDIDLSQATVSSEK